MNNPSIESSASTSRPSSDAVSQRAYELWEKAGRPDGEDMHHWLQAEQELAGSPVASRAAASSQQNGHGRTPAPEAERSTATDARSGQGTRAGKRASASPFSSNKSPNPKMETSDRRRA